MKHTQFFSYKAKAKGEKDLLFQHHECVLTKPLGLYPVGTEFTAIDIDYNDWTMQCWLVEDQDWKLVAVFDLTLHATLRGIPTD